MAAGDHLVIPFGAYQHHLLDLGDGFAIQYGGGGLCNQLVQRVEISRAFPGRPIFWLDSPASFSPEEIVARAESRIGEENYDLFRNNCEHFVNWCRTGEARSVQVERSRERLAALAARSMLIAQGRRWIRRGVKQSAGRWLRGATPWLLVADAAQWGVENAAAGRGRSPEQARVAGQWTGVGASVGIGALSAGPMGAAVGAGTWLVAELVSQTIGKMASSSES